MRFFFFFFSQGAKLFTICRKQCRWGSPLSQRSLWSTRGQWTSSCVFSTSWYVLLECFVSHGRLPEPFGELQLLRSLPAAQCQGRVTHHSTDPFTTERLILLELRDQHQAKVITKAGLVPLHHLHLLQLLSSVYKHAIMSIFSQNNSTCFPW